MHWDIPFLHFYAQFHLYIAENRTRYTVVIVSVVSHDFKNVTIIWTCTFCFFCGRKKLTLRVWKFVERHAWVQQYVYRLWSSLYFDQQWSEWLAYTYNKRCKRSRAADILYSTQYFLLPRIPLSWSNDFPCETSEGTAWFGRLWHTDQRYNNHFYWYYSLFITTHLDCDQHVLSLWETKAL